MSPLTLSLALLLALLSLATAETILTDSAGNGVLLPTTGGNITNYISVMAPMVSTSPYHVYINLNDGASHNGGTNGEHEYFYVNTPGVGVENSTQLKFGAATLLSQQWSSSFAKDAGVTGNFMCNWTNANSAMGTYTLVFDIPAGEMLSFNMTYVQSGSSPLPISQLISITIVNPVFITGDPQFVGLRGQAYQVHGIDGAVYNIISEPHTQVNSRFVFLTEGECPVIAGKKDVNCWSHPGSYLGEISYQVVVDGELHAALVQAGPAETGLAGVQVDGTALTVGDRVELGDFTMEYTSTHGVSVTTASFEFDLRNSDLFINQALRARVPLSDLKAHGLLGQTHSAATYASSLKYIEGEVDDYVVQDGNIFGSDFLYNQFQQ